MSDESTREPASTAGVGAAHAHPTLDPGTRLGRYVVLEPVGEGGMSVVVAAYDPRLDRKVAIKLLKPPLSWTRVRARLVREAHALARLIHPNVVVVHDVGEVGDALFLVEEYLDGGTLGDWVRSARSGGSASLRPPLGGASRGPPRPWREVVATFVRAGRGLAAAHAAGLVHRDFKPANVLLGQDGRVRVTDFGLVRLADETADDEADEQAAPSRDERLTHTGALVGTPAYLPPEARTGRSDARSDQFSFCVSLWEALFGELPDAGRRPEPPPGSGVPASTVQALWRGLAPKPEERHASMNALLDILARDPRAARRRAAWVAGIAVGVAAAGVGGWWVRERRQAACEEVGASPDPVWSEAERQAARQAFLATGRPFAEDAWSAAAARLDERATRLAGERRRACEATRVRGEQSGELLDRGMACLDRLRGEAQALARLFVRADAALVARAADTVSSLSPVAPCADRTALMGVPPPRPEHRERVAALRDRLSGSRVVMLAGRYADALPEAHAVREEARALGYRPLEAEAGILAGNLQDRLARASEAEGALVDAVLAAEAGGDDAMSADAWLVLARNQLGQHRPAAALTATRHAEALAARLGGREDLMAEVDFRAGEVLHDQGQYEEARTRAVRSLDVAERLHGPESPRVARVLDLLGHILDAMGRHDEAKQVAVRSLSVLERAYGPRHPNTSVGHNRLAAVLHHLGDTRAAVEHARAAAAILVDVGGADGPNVAEARTNLGVYLADAGELDEAIVELKEAMRIKERGGPESTSLALTRMNLGSTLLDARQPEQALAELTRGMAILEKTLGPEHRSVGRGVMNVARAYLALHRPNEALPRLERSLAIHEKLVGREHGTVGYLHSLRGDAYDALGRRREARAEYELAVSIVEKAMGPAHHDLSIPLLGVCRTAETPAGAVAACEHAVAITDKSPPAERGEARFALAQALWRAAADRPRARELAASARADFHAARLGEDEREADAWLASHGAP